MDLSRKLTCLLKSPRSSYNGSFFGDMLDVFFFLGGVFLHDSMRRMKLNHWILVRQQVTLGLTHQHILGSMHGSAKELCVTEYITCSLSLNIYIYIFIHSCMI